jgi:hypothetical protein
MDPMRPFESVRAPSFKVATRVPEEEHCVKFSQVFLLVSGADDKPGYASPFWELDP